MQEIWKAGISSEIRQKWFLVHTCIMIRFRFMISFQNLVSKCKGQGHNRWCVQISVLNILVTQITIVYNHQQELFSCSLCCTVLAPKILYARSRNTRPQRDLFTKTGWAEAEWGWNKSWFMDVSVYRYKGRKKWIFSDKL